jgi:hypothetical protein
VANDLDAVSPLRIVTSSARLYVKRLTPLRADAHPAEAVPFEAVIVYRDSTGASTTVDQVQVGLRFDVQGR